MQEISAGLDKSLFENLNNSLVRLQHSVENITNYNYTELIGNITELKKVENLIEKLNVFFLFIYHNRKHKKSWIIYQVIFLILVQY